MKPSLSCSVIFFVTPFVSLLLTGCFASECPFVAIIISRSRVLIWNISILISVQWNGSDAVDGDAGPRETPAASVVWLALRLHLKSLLLRRRRRHQNPPLLAITDGGPVSLLFPSLSDLRCHVTLSTADDRKPKQIDGICPSPPSVCALYWKLTVDLRSSDDP